MHRLLEGFDNFQYEGWDGEDAFPVTDKALEVADLILTLLPDSAFPQPSPGYDGSITIECIWGNKELFIDIDDKGRIEEWRFL